MVHDFGYPRRSAVGIHSQRLELILAVLEKEQSKLAKF